MELPDLHLNLSSVVIMQVYECTGMSVTCRKCSFSPPLTPSIVSHLQPSVLIVSYIESAKAAAQFGFYQKAEWKPDDSMIAVAVSSPVGFVKVLLLSVISAAKVFPDFYLFMYF